MKMTTLHINALSIAVGLLLVGAIAMLVGHECVASGVFGIAGGVALKFSDQGGAGNGPAEG